MLDQCYVKGPQRRCIVKGNTVLLPNITIVSCHRQDFVDERDAPWVPKHKISRRDGIADRLQGSEAEEAMATAAARETTMARHRRRKHFRTPTTDEIRRFGEPVVRAVSVRNSVGNEARRSRVIEFHRTRRHGKI